MASNKPASSPLPFSAAQPALTDFIAGGNHELITAVTRLAEGRSDIGSVYIWGDSGGGKSTLLRAVCGHARGLDFPTYLAGGDRDELPPVAEGLLAIDDVHTLGAAAQSTLLEWLQRAGQRSQRQFLLVSADCTPSALPVQSPLASRLAAGLVFRLLPLSDADKDQALAAWAKRRGFDLPADISQYLLTRLPRNMHSLTIALSALDEYCLAQKKPLTLRRVSNWLSQHGSVQSPPV